MSEDLENPALFHKSRASWLDFNARVLEEAQDPHNPLLERVKFLAIVANNLDEFFEVQRRRTPAVAPGRIHLVGSRPVSARRPVGADRREGTRAGRGSIRMLERGFASRAGGGKYHTCLKSRP